jgi:hypothetical protein
VNTPPQRTTRQQWEKLYKSLRAYDPEAFRKAIQAAEGCAINHHLSSAIAADIEVSHVALACELLGVML